MYIQLFKKKDIIQVDNIEIKDVNRMIFNNRLIVKDKAPFNRL